VRYAILGADKPASRRVVDWLFDYGRMDGLCILSKTGLARYAWERAEHLAKHRQHFYLERELKSQAMGEAVRKLATQGKPGVALVISPRPGDANTVRLLRDAGIMTVIGRLDAGKNVIWEQA